MIEEQDYIKITEENWEQFVGHQVQVSNIPSIWVPRTLYHYVTVCGLNKFAAGEQLWSYARIAKPKEKVFKVSPDRREIFEALAKGALIRSENTVINSGCSDWEIDGDHILLTPDYTRPLAEQEWIRMEVSE